MIFQLVLDGIPFFWQVASEPDSPNTVDFDTSLVNGVRLEFAYIMNLEEETGEYGFTGRVRLAHPLTIRRNGRRRCVVIDFSEGISPENIEVDIDALPARLSEREAEMSAAIRDMLTVQLQQERCLLETANLCFEVDQEDTVIDPMEVSEASPLSLQMVDGITCWRSCLIILLTTGGGHTGDRRAFNTCEIAIPPEVSVALTLGNDLVLRRLVFPSILESFELTGSVDNFFDFDDSGALLRDMIYINNFVDDNRVEQTVLTRLDVTIADAQYNIEGLVTMSGTGWSSHFSFSGSVVVEINDEGRPEFRSEIDTTMIDFRFSWWVWVVGMLGQGSMLAGIGGQIASRIITTIMQNGFARSLSDSFNQLFPQPDVPFPALPFSLDISDAEIDDLTFYGRPRFPERPPEYEGPKVWIDGDFEVTDVQVSGGNHMVVLKVVNIYQTTFKKAHYGAFRARRSLLVAPFKYNWYLDDVPLEGEATVQIGDAEIRYSLLRDSCELWLASGDSLAAELKVVVEDARGRIADSRRTLTVEGSIDSVGVTGAEIVAGPIVDLFGKETVLDELASRGLVAPGESSPDESQSEEPSRLARTNAFRKALSLGMEMDLSDMPFDS